MRHYLTDCLAALIGTPSKVRLEMHETESPLAEDFMGTRRIPTCNCLNFQQ